MSDLDKLTEEIEGGAVAEPEVEAGPDPEVVALAKRHGWKEPQGDFTPKNWVDADRYLELTPVKLKIAQAEKVDLNERLARLEQSTQTVVQQAQERTRLEYEAKLAQVRAEQRQAVEGADLDRFTAAKAIEDRILRAAPPQPAQPETAYNHPEARAYRDRNPWTQDPEMMQYAFAVVEQTPGKAALSAARQYEWAEKQVREAFPDRFDPKPEPRQTTSRVDAGGLASSRSRDKGYSELPPEAKTACDRFVSQGFTTREAYAKTYWSQQ